jgi:pimeloyl-ACP methyl ester carboxylesterase
VSHVTTVLFVHGLESGPRGKKALALEEAGFKVVSGQMPCSRNAVLRDPAVIALIVFALGVLIAATMQGVLGFMITLIAYSVLFRFVQPLLMRRTFKRSVAVQLELLRTNQVDVVLGSSFGGAVAVELLASGAWKGPAVLLCPAHLRVAERAWRPSPELPADAAKILVVHGRQDETVPISHSRSLVKGTAARLIEVDDDHRLTATAKPERFKEWIAELLDRKH